MSERIAYDIDEAAALVALSKDTLTKAINRGDLRAKRSGRKDDGTPTGKRVILRSELLAWAERLVDA